MHLGDVAFRAAAALALAAAAASGQDSGPNRTLSGEIYSRLEFSEPQVVNRLRFKADLPWSPSLRFRLELDDVRTSGGALNLLDIRQAAFALNPRPGWMLLAGRQEITLGDERLIGADTQWNPQSPTFDGVTLEYALGRWHAGAFAARPVVVRPSQIDQADHGSFAAGGFVARKFGDLVLEPYFVAATDHSGERRRTAGVRSTASWSGGFDTNVEVAVQRSSAWAGYWELGQKREAWPMSPRAWVEYNFATGGSRTFDDLYPAAYNRFGLEDPFPWRDTRYPGVGAELDAPRLRLSGTYRRYRQASTLEPLGSHWILAAEFEIGSRIGLAGALEGYRGTGLHPLPGARPFLSLRVRL